MEFTRRHVGLTKNGIVVVDIFDRHFNLNLRHILKHEKITMNSGKYENK